MADMHVECAVIGAGVVGLAIAARLAQQGREVVLLEKEPSFGMATSSRNSEVIHAGIYYPEGSLKAQHCVRGRHLLYEYCQEHGVPHRRIGKVIVAVTEDEVKTLVGYQENAIRNGVHSLEWLTAEELRAREPNVQGVCALWSPETGILDSHQFMESLVAAFENAGGLFIRKTRLVGGHVSATEKRLMIEDDVQSTVTVDTVINAAGLHASEVAELLHAKGSDIRIPHTHYAVGHYYTLAGPSPFTHLVYPVAQKGGLGVHVTLDMGGAVRFGPDVRWIDSLNYDFSDSRRDDFVAAIQRYFPALDPLALEPGYTGIRPKIGGPDHPNVDFQILTPSTHGIKGLVHLLGIESPGLTAALSIAEVVEASLTSNATAQS
jgi:L-2-hydroxyglutarate oxidase LhgO